MFIRNENCSQTEETTMSTLSLIQARPAVNLLLIFGVSILGRLSGRLRGLAFRSLWPIVVPGAAGD